MTALVLGWLPALMFGAVVALVGMPVTLALAEDAGAKFGRRVAIAIGIAAAAGFAILTIALLFVKVVPAPCNL